MQLSNKEYKYRCKIIAENHLKKDVQRYLDQYIKEKLITYKTLYLNCHFLPIMLTQYHLSNTAKTLAIATNAFKTLATSLALFGDSMRSINA